MSFVILYWSLLRTVNQAKSRCDWYIVVFDSCVKFTLLPFTVLLFVLVTEFSESFLMAWLLVMSDGRRALYLPSWIPRYLRSSEEMATHIFRPTVIGPGTSEKKRNNHHSIRVVPAVHSHTRLPYAKFSGWNPLLLTIIDIFLAVHWVNCLNLMQTIKWDLMHSQCFVVSFFSKLIRKIFFPHDNISKGF